MPAQKANKPLSVNAPSSKYSIKKHQEDLQKKLQEKEEVVEEVEDLPNNHFTQTDLDDEWSLFLDKIKSEDAFLHNIIQGFRLVKEEENVVRIHFPSDYSRSEFEKVGHEFFNRFKHKVNHFSIDFQFSRDRKMKIEVVTKRKIFEKMAEKNPNLLKLHEIFKFNLDD